MLVCNLVLVVFTLCLPETIAVDEEDQPFTAVVVEYSPPIDPTLDPFTNILNNVDNYIDFINLANNELQADIIVFPEVGLKGYFNGEVYLEIPDPKDSVRPCAQDTIYDAPLVQLSCAARATATYVVVNLAEKFFNTSQQRTLYFNTDVVFDRNGIVVARYRKIHLFGEHEMQSPEDKALVYFDTDFGVRFGLLTCFDIIFEDPGVVLAKKYNVTHFIFPTAWFSEMPFLTAIQEQFYWAYTLDVLLLASGHNLPSSGSSGTGIYLGRQGPLTYNMTENTGSFMLYAKLPRKYSGRYKLSPTSSGKLSINDYIKSSKKKGLHLGMSSSKLKLKRDHVDVYLTEMITIPDSAQRIFNGSDVIIPFTIDRTLCHNTLCCNFSLEVSITFSKSRSSERSRRDDYSGLYYRLAAFDGVRTYDRVDTGGLQTCAILPCVTKDLSSCGLPADDPSAKTNTLLQLYQTKFIFQSIKITGNFSNNNSFVGPNVLVAGEYDNFGAILAPQSFNFMTDNLTDFTVVNAFKTVEPVTNLVTASLYGRLFSKDGQDHTPQNVSLGFALCINVSILIASLLLLNYNNYKQTL